MSETPGLVVAFVAGLVLAGMFFGGLWWTIQRGVVSAHPAAWFLVGPLLRMSIAVSGFYFVSHGDWRRLLACGLGFAVGRFVVLRQLRPRSERPGQAACVGRP